MLLGEVADTLIACAKALIKTEDYEKALRFDQGKPIDSTVAARFVQLLLVRCPKTVPDNIKTVLESKSKKWSLSATESILRNGHTNSVGASRQLDRNVAESLLVDFINFAVIPLDLAMYTSDLHKT